MISVENKILSALMTNKLNPTKLGERKWYNYFIRVTELFWGINNFDGYKIEVYDEKYGNHLITVIL